jgi:hypothetical protein
MKSYRKLCSNFCHQPGTSKAFIIIIIGKPLHAYIAQKFHCYTLIYAHNIDLMLNNSILVRDRFNEKVKKLISFKCVIIANNIYNFRSFLSGHHSAKIIFKTWKQKKIIKSDRFNNHLKTIKSVIID